MIRVSVDGDWLCLRELDGEMDVAGCGSSLSPPSGSNRGKWTPTTPEFEQMVRYPTYPVGRTGTGLKTTKLRFRNVTMSQKFPIQLI